MVMAGVSGEEFKGVCEECGDFAHLKPVPITALLQNMETQRLAACGTNFVYCESGHTYFILDMKTQVDDPFEPDEVFDTSPLD